MATPTDRLDDEYLTRKREEEARDLLEWAQSQVAPPETPRAAPGEAESAEPAEASAEAPNAPQGVTGAFADTAQRAGRLLQEGGESILRGAGTLAGTTAPAILLRGARGEALTPWRLGGETISGALDVLSGMAKGLGVLNPVVNQPAMETALRGAGLSEEAARTGADLSQVAGPVAITKIPALAKAVKGRGAVQTVVREITGTPKEAVEETAEAGRAVTPTAAPSEPTPAQTALERLQALAADFDVRVARQRRGTRTREQAMTEGKALPMSLDDIRALFPGTAMNDAQAARLVDVLFTTAEEGMGLLKTAAASGDEAAIDAALDHFALLMHADPARAGVLAEAGRTLGVLNDPVSGMNAYLDQVVGVLQEASGLTKAQLVQRLAALKSPQELATLAAKAQQPGMGDVFTELWVNMLLSSPQTHVVNTLSNTLTAAWVVPERLVGSLIGMTHGGMQPAEVYHATYGAIQGLKDGWRLAAKAFREGAPVSKLDQPVRRAIRGETFGLTGDWGRGVDFLGEGVRLPTRFLMSADEFFKSVAYRTELHALAYRSATEAGLSGKAAAQHMAQIVANPPKSIKDAAERFATYQTFQTELGPRMTGVQQTFSGPVGKLFVPFLKTPTNIFTYSLERTPLAPFIGTWRADVKAGGARRDLALAKLSLGSATMALVTQYAAEGRITGGGPKGPERDEWLETHQPYSIRIGTKWVSFSRLDPVGMLMGFAADFAEISGSLNEATAGEFALALTAAMAKNLTSKTYMASVADVVEALENPDQKIERVVGRLSRSLVPRAVAGIERVVDPELRDPTPSPDTPALARTFERMFNEISSQVPGFSKALPPKRNLFGEPIRLGYGEAWEWVNPIYVRDVNTDPVAQELVRTQVRLTMPTRSIPGGMAGAAPIPLTPEEYDRYVQLAAGKGLPGAKPLKATLAEVMATDLYRRQTDGPDGGKALAIRAVVQGYRDAARAHLIAESETLQGLIRGRMEERARQLTPTGAVGVGPSQ